MGIDVRLTDEQGNIEGQVFDSDNRLHSLLKLVPDWQSTHCLQYIDRYGDTTFNARQIARFLEEWNKVEEVAASRRDRTLVTDIRDLAQRGAGQNHLYLTFAGA